MKRCGHSTVEIIVECIFKDALHIHKSRQTMQIEIIMTFASEFIELDNGHVGSISLDGFTTHWVCMLKKLRCKLIMKSTWLCKFSFK